jgi:hypothetical protein
MSACATLFGLLMGLLIAAPSARAGKVPATVNVGVGPTVTWLGDPGNGPMARSVGVSFMAEGYVSKKTLRSKKVMRRVPRKYRGFVKSLEDAHVVPLPLMLVPDIVALAPIPVADDPGPSVMPVSWAPITVSLIHKTKGPHIVLDVQPRVSWLRMEDASEKTANAVWLGGALGPEFQSSLKRRVGVALGGHAGAGWVPQPKETLQGYHRPWLHTDAYARLQLRFPIAVDM